MTFTLFKPVYKKIIIYSIFLSFSLATVRGALQSVIIQLVSPKIQGSINSYTTSLDSIAQIIGSLIGGLIFDLSVRGIIDVSWWGFITALFGGIALILFFKKYTSDEVIKYRKRLNEYN
jgi:MFS family permease